MNTELTTKLPPTPSLRYCDVKMVPSNWDYGIMEISGDAKDFFPGRKQQFIMRTPVGDFVLHRVGVRNDVPCGTRIGPYIGHPRPGSIVEELACQVPDSLKRREGSLLRFYEKMHQLKIDDVLRVYLLPERVYKIGEINPSDSFLDLKP